MQKIWKQLLVAIVTLFVALSSVAAWAASPGVGTLQPRGGQRGTELDVQFVGGRLADAQRALFSGPGIEVVSVKPVNDGQATVHIKIAPDCPLGFRPVYLQTLSGLSNPKYFFVGSMKQIEETEPNDNKAAAPKVELNTTIGGTIASEDTDNFSFDAAAGQRLNFEVEGLRLGDSRLDPMIVLFDPNGIEVASADDTSLTGQDCALGYTVKTAGAHTIQVREASFGGGGDYHYRLHLGTFPRPLGVFPAGGKPGETLKVRWLGDSQMNEGEITLPKEIGIQPVYPTADGLLPPSEVPMMVSNLENLFEVEPNDTITSGTEAHFPAAFNGVLDKDGDVDWYIVDVKKGQGLNVQLYGRRLRSPIDSVVTLNKLDGSQVAGADDGAGLDSVFDYAATEDGKLAVLVTDQLRRGGPGFFYRLEIAPIEPKTWTTVYRPGPGTVYNTSVPMGNRTAMMLQVQRRAFGGAMNVAATNLPAGMKAEVPAFTENQSDLPVLFSAEEATTASASLANLVATPANGQPAISGGIEQDVVLVRIENDVIVMTHPQKELPLAVTQPIPFKIDVKQPKVPLVQNGRMGLIVSVARQEGYKEAVDLRLLWNPPGISSGTPRIEATQTTQTLELNAAGNAGVGDWKIVVMATGGFDAGGRAAVEVSSQILNLNVSAPWINIALDKARTEQGSPVDLAGKLTLAHEFQGEAQLELIGLPPKVLTQIEKITKDSKDIKYHLEIAKDAPAGKYDPFVRATVYDQGEPIVHHIGQGELKIDAPIPPPAGATPTPVPVAGAAAPEKPKGPQPGDRKRAVGIAPFNRGQ